MKFEKHIYPLIIKEGHLDTFGHMNNATYLQILEEARWDFITARGYGFKKVHETGLGPIILEINMRFLKELRLREQVTIESEALAYDGKIAKLRQDIFDERRERCFEATMTFGFFDLKARKLILPTPEWLRAVGAIQE